jgi:hypothetical protein
MKKMMVLFSGLLVVTVLLVVGCDNGNSDEEEEQKEEVVGATYTVTFNTNGGAAVEPKSVKDGEALGTALPTPTFADHVFVSWFTSDADYAATAVFAADTPVKADVTVYAKWVDAAGAYGKQEDDTWILDPAGFKADWYGAAVDGDVVTYTGGGIDYLFPTTEGFAIADYESVEIKYFVYGWEPLADVTDNKTQLAVKDWNGKDGPVNEVGDGVRANTGDYPTLSKGAGSFTIGTAGGGNFPKLQATGIEGFCLGVNAYSSGNTGGGLTNFKVKYYSIKLNPKTVVDVDSGKQADGTYVLDHTAGWSEWYSASMSTSDTIAFTGGGMDYLFPVGEEAKLDITEYAKLVIKYETSGYDTTDELPLKLTVHGWKTTDTNGRSGDLAYPTLNKGGAGGEIVIDDAEKFALLAATDNKGLDLQVNTYEDGSQKNFNMKIISMILSPAAAE